MTEDQQVYSPAPHNPLVAKALPGSQTAHAQEPSSNSSRSSRVPSSFSVAYDGDSRATTPDSALAESFPKPDVTRPAQGWGEKDAFAGAAAGEDDGLLLAAGVAGRQPEEVYTRTLSWWRAGLRRAIVRNVEWESAVLARMQVRAPPLRSPRRCLVRVMGVGGAAGAVLCARCERRGWLMAVCPE